MPKAENASRISPLRFAAAATHFPVAVNLASQALGLLQYILLISWFGANRTSDYLFLLLSWCALPLQLIITGVAFPLMLRGDQKGARTWFVASQCISPFFMIPPVIIMRPHLDAISSPAVIAVLVFGYSLSVLYATWEGLGAAAEGKPLILSAATILGSVGSIIGLAAAKVTSFAEPIGSMLVVATGFQIAFTLIAKQRNHRDGRTSISSDDGTSVSALSRRSRRQRSGSTSAWFLGKSIAGYGGGLSLQSFSSTMPASFLSYFSVAQRLIGGVAGAYSNSVLPRFVHGSTTNPIPAIRLSARLSGLISIVSIGGGVGSYLVGRSELAGWLLAGGAWASASLFSAGVQRLSYRLLDPSNALISICTCVVTVLTVSLTAATGHLSSAVLIAGVIALDGITAVVLAARLNARSYALAVGMLLLTSTIPGVLLLN